jgi:hypothetical protein
MSGQIYRSPVTNTTRAVARRLIPSSPMRRSGLVGFSMALALVAVTGGCKNDVLGQNPGSGGSGGVGSCATDLSGTWDVMATKPGSASGTFAWVLTLDATTFSMSASGDTLLYTAGATKQLTWTRPSGVIPITVSNAPAAVNAGSLPLALGGNWSLSANDEVCNVIVGATTVTGSCQGPGGPGSSVGNGGTWPHPLPNPRHDRIYSANRLSPLASQLGDFGGQWQLSNGAGATCTATVEGNRLTATCTNAHPLTGSLQLTLGNDCVASGSSGGYELSARRR